MSPEAYKSYVTSICELETLTVPVEFEQKEEPLKTGTEGRELTVTTVAALVAEHPFAFVTVTVYDPEVLTVIEDAVAPLLHKYEVPALEVKTTFPP